MKIAPISSHNQTTKKGARIGAAAGAGVAAADIIKNHKNTFQIISENAKKLNLPETVAKKAMIKGYAATIGGLVLIGAAIGAVTGKIIDVHKAKKAVKLEAQQMDTTV